MLARFRLLYKLRIDDGEVRVVTGNAPPRFIAAVRDIVSLHAIEQGEIECKGAGRHARLRFAAGFPETGRQAIRNVWPAPTTPGPGSGRRARG
ncbi:DUF3634 family protein [Salinisphaera sp. T31B1]|uniref:DUF3634 family protein n=1 Tax=Salinisphaera sp. T31B1 TaxID=727963 RepID=UPI0033405A88